MIDLPLQHATAVAPATVANVAVGFDILGFSLSDLDGRGLADRVRVERVKEPGVRLITVEGDPSLPDDPERNCATAGLVAMARDRELDFGLHVSVFKGVPQARGLGGAAASAVAAVVAASAVLDTPLSLPERFKYALLGEAVATGEPRGDNVAPAMLGGLILVRSMDPFDVVRIPVPHDFGAVLVVPEHSVDVRLARANLGKDVPLDAHVAQSANLAGFITGCFRDDRDLIARSLRDLVIEPWRAPSVEGFEAVQQAAFDAGALGCSISGAGPACFALHDFRTRGKTIEDAMLQAFEAAGVPALAFRSPVNGLGAHLIERGPLL
ncbi:homoserine kinase [Lujinxingia litoralis]|uniref:Homoserine kinase n=1 Tax=Lujinxingia litoralis TaxID=2211119 RepID=A0A328C432_9DELT|nr:homoserine kinase [Lujinxingia litoralis]RAL21278.1 homoserine kinase [Lujinxingia litoralis]